MSVAAESSPAFEVDSTLPRSSSSVRSLLPATLPDSSKGLWDVAERVSSWSIRQEWQYFGQVVRTGIPFWLADVLAVAVISLMAASLTGVLYGTGMGVLAQWSLLWIVGLSSAQVISGMYPGIGIGGAREMRATMVSVSMLTLCGLAFALVHEFTPREAGFVVFWSLIGIGLAAALPIVRVAVRRMVSKQSWWGLPILVIGNDERATRLFEKLAAAPWLGFKPVGILEDTTVGATQGVLADEFGYLGTVSEAPRFAGERGVFWALLAWSDRTEEDHAHFTDHLACVFPELLVAPEISNVGRSWNGHLELGDLHLLRITERSMLPGARLTKRALDMAIVLLMAPFVLPVMAMLAVAVKMTSPGPVFYSQPRVGRCGRMFSLWKLRSMVVNGDQVLKSHLAAHPELRPQWDKYQKLPNDPRVTSIGRLIRKTSLDEVPQLWNVFCGQMSLVGPRPMLANQVDRYADVFQLYLRMLPGITGLWQVSGRNQTTYEKRVACDQQYVRNWSVWFDLNILFRTIKVVLTGHGAC